MRVWELPFFLVPEYVLIKAYIYIGFKMVIIEEFNMVVVLRLPVSGNGVGYVDVQAVLLCVVVKCMLPSAFIYMSAFIGIL
jgi:hypothetical protein